jgi:DNA-binding transcriptional MerR regulator
MSYSMKEIEKKTGVKRHCLHTWILIGLFIPSPESKIARGNGIRSEYSEKDAYKISLLKKLLEAGIHGKLAKLLTSSNQGISTAEKLLKDIEALSRSLE